MKNLFTQLAVEDFTTKVADKVVERGADKIADKVVEKIKPILSNSGSTSHKASADTILTRKETAALLKMSEPTLRKMYTNGPLKAHGVGTRHMRFKSSEVFAVLENL